MPRGRMRLSARALSAGSLRARIAPVNRQTATAAPTIDVLITTRRMNPRQLRGGGGG